MIETDSITSYYRSIRSTRRPTETTSWSTYSGEACSQQKSSSSSSSSAADVDVHAAWDNYDLTLPVDRRRSDDRCSLLTQWTESTASLKSCLSHNATSRSLVVSTAAESDGGTFQRPARTSRRQPGCRDRCRGYMTSSSKRCNNLSSRCSKSQSRKCEFVGSAVLQRCHCGTERRAVNSPSSCRDTGRSRSWWSTSAPRRRHTTARDVDVNDDDYMTTSSEGEDHPSTSTSSCVPPNYVEDKASLLSTSTTSSSALFSVPSSNRSCHRSLQQPAKLSFRRLSRQVYQSPRRRKSTGSFRSLTNSSDMHDDDNELESSRSSEEITIASRCNTREAIGPSREDELRAVKSLFDFRSADALRIANNFVDGAWNLYSRRSLYNERYISSKTASLTSSSPTSFFRLTYSRSEKDFQSNTECDAREMIANDDRNKNYSDVTGNVQSNLDVVDDDKSSRRPNVADVIYSCDVRDALDDWNISRRDIRPLEIIAELTDVTATISNEDDSKIHIRKSPKTFNDTLTDDRDAEMTDTKHGVSLSKVVKSACDKQLEHAADSDSMSQRQNETTLVGEKSPETDRSTLQSNLLVTGPKALMEVVDSNSRFASELIHVFDALLVRSGVGETASVAADIKMFHPLTDGANKLPGAPKLLRADTDSVATTFAKPSGDPFESTANISKSGERVYVSKHRCRKKRERKPGILRSLTSRLSDKSDLTCHLASTKSINPMSCTAKEANSELYSPKQTACADIGRMTTTTSTQTNEFIDDLQSIADTRMRTSRKSRGRGKVRELIKLFESASASTLSNNASPIDVKRATISAAVSVGELLRRSSEQEVTPLSQHACASPDVNVKQRSSLPNLTEALNSADVAKAPRVFGDDCISKPEVSVVVRRSTARWPTTSRVRSLHARPHVYPVPARDRASSRINVNRLSKTRSSTSDARQTPANNDSKSLPQADNIIEETLEANSLLNKEGMKPMNEDNFTCKCRDAAIVRSANYSLRTGPPEAHGCDIAKLPSTSNVSSSECRNNLPTAVDSVGSLSTSGRRENVYQLPSSSSSSSSSSTKNWPMKSLHTCEVSVTASASTLVPSACGNREVGGDHEKGEPCDGNKQSAAHFNDEVHPVANYTVPSRTMHLPREQSVSTASPTSAIKTTKKSMETSLAEDDCQRFNAPQSWFIAGGPRLVEVPQWSVTYDVAVDNWRQSRANRPVKAALRTETGCPLAYPVLRKTDMTVHINDDNNNKRINERNKGTSIKHTDDSYSRKERQPIKQSRSYDVETVKPTVNETVPKSTKGNQQLSEKSASYQPKKETACNNEITKTTRLDPEFYITATSSGADFHGRGTQKNHDPLEREYKSVNPLLSTNQRITSDVTPPSDSCPRPVQSHAPSDGSLSKRPLPDKQKEASTTSSTMAKCETDSGKSTQSLGGVTVVYSRLWSATDVPNAGTVKTRSQVRSQTQPRDTTNYKLAQQFLLTSLLEYRLDAQKK